jgi:molybdopterin converting factor small subunit
VGDLIARVRAEPGGTGLPARVLAAVNLVQASDATPLAEADEVALLPPLAGG